MNILIRSRESLIKLAKLDELRVDVIVPAIYFDDIKLGMKAVIIPEINMNQAYQAEVSIVDKLIDASSGTFDVRLSLPNGNYQLPGGLKCRIQFKLSS